MLFSTFSLQTVIFNAMSTKLPSFNSVELQVGAGIAYLIGNLALLYSSVWMDFTRFHHRGERGDMGLIFTVHTEIDEGLEIVGESVGTTVENVGTMVGQVVKRAVEETPVQPFCQGAETSGEDDAESGTWT